MNKQSLQSKHMALSLVFTVYGETWPPLRDNSLDLTLERKTRRPLALELGFKLKSSEKKGCFWYPDKFRLTNAHFFGDFAENKFLLKIDSLKYSK